MFLLLLLLLLQAAAFYVETHVSSLDCGEPFRGLRRFGGNLVLQQLQQMLLQQQQRLGLRFK